MNVALFMTDARPRGGVERLLRHLLRHRQEAGAGAVRWQVVFFEDGPMRAELEAEGVATRLIRTGRLREAGRYAAAVRRIARLLRREQIDLAFSWKSKAHLYVAPAAWWTGCPAAWYQHGLPAAPGLLDRLITLLPARGVVACSQAAADAQRERLWPARPARVVHPCVDLDAFCPERLPAPALLRRRLDLPEEGPLIGIVGRLQRWKGIHVLLEALPAIRQAHPGAHAVVVGGRHAFEPGYADTLGETVAALDLHDHVTMAGFQDNVAEWMQAMDVVVHASDAEPFGMVVIEAMALGKPVVAGAKGGPREIITEGADGLLAPYGDAGALARQVLRYLDEPDFRKGVAEAARRRAQAFSAARYARTFADAIRPLA